MPTYTFDNYQDDVQRDASNVANIRRILNRAARAVVNDRDLRSTKRKIWTGPVLHEELFDYQAPADLKDLALIDVIRGEGRDTTDHFDMVQNEYFDRHKSLNKNLVAIDDHDFLKKLRISAELRGGDVAEVVVHDCESLTDDGTWAVSLDASALTLDEDVFLYGEASLNFDMDQAGTTTTVGILLNSDMDQKDLTGYEDGSVYVSVYAPLITGLDGFTLRIGNDASNYYSLQVTTTNEGLAFYVGWNLLRFDLKNATQTGTVDLSEIDYVRFTIDKGNDSLQSKDWRLDNIVARRGRYHELLYYTKYPWQTSSGTYIENSTVDGDLLNADTHEYELFILKGKEMLAQDQGNWDEMKMYRQQYQDEAERYEENYPSERLLLRQDYRTFGNDPDQSWLDDTNR